MPFWDFLRKQEPGDVAVAVPLNYDVGQATYPDASFESFATEGYGKSEIVHACIRELAVSSASPRYYVQAPAQGGGSVEITSGLLHDLTSKPNPTSDWYSFVETLVTYLMVAGNSYTLKERNRSGRVSALYHLRPDRVRIIGGDHGAEGYVYTVGGKDYPIPREDICHLALPNPGGDLYGLSPLQVLARNVNLDLNMTDFAKVYFQNAGVPSGLLKLKRRLNTQEEASTIRARWRSQFGGRNNFHRIAILDEDADYVPMANSPKDMALPELHDLTESRICAVFGVPAILVGANVGLQRSTYSNYREARMAFHSETLEPMVSRILRHLNRNLFDEYSGNETLTVDWAEMRSGLDNREAMTSRVTGLFAGGILTLNEAREQLGLIAVTDGGLRRIPASIFEVPGGTRAPVAVGAAPVEESLPIGMFKEELPALKAPRVARRAGLLRRQLLEDREEETDRMAKQVQRHFRGLRNRVDGILGRYMERGGSESKDFPFGADELMPPGEIPNLQAIIEQSMTRMSKKTVAAINANGLAGTLDWSEKLPFIQSVLVHAPTRATMIHSTTNRAIQRGVATALERGYSISQLARGVPDDKFPGLRSILTETENRSRLIARTEVMRAQNQTSVGFFQEQGFNYVQADDVDGDPDDTYIDPGDPYGRTCAERHGQIYTLDDARNIDDHPNGTLNWMPMPRGYKPEGQVDVPSVPVDRSDPFGPDFSASEWKPDVVLGAGVGTESRVGAVAAMRQTVANLKGDLGTYIAKLYSEKPSATPQIVKSGHSKLKVPSPRTGKTIDAAGVYRPTKDTLYVKEGRVEWAMTHEIGHQITSKHINPMLGVRKGNAFRAEAKAAFSAAKKRETREILPGVKQSGSITDYAMSDLDEYMAEGFKWAQQKPSVFTGVDDELLRIMRKYLVTDKPVSFDTMLIQGGK